jgi:16S rRNA (guanine(966)-N(2))-methyltransferase RsmD
MRERAFAVIGDRVVDARFLDLYAGTGAVGLEALSRGARAVVFVERHRAIARVVRDNCAAFGLETRRAELRVKPVLAAVSELAKSGETFDVVWADPPFESWEEGARALESAFFSGLLSTSALACLECPAKADVAGSLAQELKIVRDLAGGASRVVMITIR